MVKFRCSFGVLLMCTAVLSLLMSCSSDDDFESKLILANESVDVGNQGGKKSIEVLTNAAWTAETDVDWITLDTVEGDKGRFMFEFIADKNEDDEREGVISFLADNGEGQDFMVVQEAGNKEDIYVLPDGSGEGYSWADATNLDDALQIATSGNTIHIAEGTYKPGNTVTGGDTSDDRDKTFEIRKNISLIGGYSKEAAEGSEPDPSQYRTVFSGDDLAYHVVTISASKSADERVEVDGITITEGRAYEEASSADIDGIKFRRDYGGGMTIGEANVVLRNVAIEDNKSDKFSAGLYIFEDSKVSIENSIVTMNKSKSNVGGIWIKESVLFLDGSEVTYNESGTAGGIHGYPEAKVYVNNSIIANNISRSFGAGFYLRDNSEGVIVNSLITENESQATSGGGGIMMYNGNEVTVINSTITNNDIKGPGGGIYGQNSVNIANVYNSIVSGNKQKEGSSDIDFDDPDSSAPKIVASISGSKVFDLNENELDSKNFDSSSMLENIEKYVYKPKGDKDSNPALEYGMSVERLKELGESQEPVIEGKVITYDLLHADRSESTTMGAFIK